MALHDVKRDVLFVSQTGSGKTLMFLLPMLEQLGRVIDTASILPEPTALFESIRPSEPDGLIIVPTPDLAVQVQSIASQLVAAMPFSLAVESLHGTLRPNDTSRSSSRSIAVGTTEQLHERLQHHDLSTRRLHVVAVDEVDAVLCTRHVEDAPVAMECAVSPTHVSARQQTLCIKPRGFLYEAQIGLLNRLREHTTPRFLLATAHLSDAHERVLEELFPAKASVRHTV